MQNSRLLEMLLLLMEKGTVSAPKMAERFEVSVRTIYRDIDALSAAGVPVYVTTGRNGGAPYRSFPERRSGAEKIGGLV